MTKSLDLDVPTLLLSPLNSVFPCKCPSPSAAFILKVFLSFIFCFWSYFFFPSHPIFVFVFHCPCHNFVLEGTCFIITSFVQVETGTHPCVYFQKSALVTPQPPDISLPQAVYRRGCGVGGSNQRQTPVLGGVLKLYLRQSFFFV